MGLRLLNAESLRNGPCLPFLQLQLVLLFRKFNQVRLGQDHIWLFLSRGELPLFLKVVVDLIELILPQDLGQVCHQFLESFILLLDKVV